MYRFSEVRGEHVKLGWAVLERDGTAAAAPAFNPDSSLAGLQGGCCWLAKAGIRTCDTISQVDYLRTSKSYGLECVISAAGYP